MLLSFEILRPQGAFAFVIAWATLLLLIRSGASSPAGVEEHVQTDIWVLQELERSCRLLGNIRPELPGEQLQASAAVLVRRGANTASTTEGPPSEGNEVRWEGRQEVVMP